MFESLIEGPVAVIGDLHGQTQKLKAIREQLRALPDIKDRWIVFIGDLVDRGPDPAGGLEMLLGMMDEFPKVTAVSGNHDLAMSGAIDLIDTPDFANWKTRWVGHYDSETTFRSYEVAHGDLAGLAGLLPSRHAEVLVNLPWCVEHPEYLFVHAGLDPLMTYEMQIQILRDRDLTMTHPPWLCDKAFCDKGVPRDCPKTVVSGHVHFEDVQFRDRKILCDTTGGRGGDLSCVLLPEKKVLTSSGTENRSGQRSLAIAGGRGGLRQRQR